jgi:DNA modification methylase
MAVIEQKITDKFAVYNGDCVETMKGMTDCAIDLSIYSPPFMGLYVYSSDERDMSNSIDKDEFFEHYGYCVDEIARITKPGRISAVHCSDIPLSNSGCDAIFDLAGEIIRIQEARGFRYGGRRLIWKEPLMVRNRTMMKSLAHKTFCSDTTKCSIANADWILMFRRDGQNAVPVEKPTGATSYAGERMPPNDLLGCKGMKGDQKQNRYSQWIWRQYASSLWDDIRIDKTLPHREGSDPEDEKHVHPLQLDVIERACVLWSNPGEVVFTPFMGVGSEVYGAVINGRKGVGVELKTSYYRQAIRNLEAAETATKETLLFDC